MLTDNSQSNVNSAIVGRNAIKELLKSGRDIDKIFVMRGDRQGSISVLVAEAIKRKIPVVEVERSTLDNMSGGIPHQGIAAFAAEHDYVSVEDILSNAKLKSHKPLIIILDDVEDPHNLGAVIRTAEAVGADGVIIPKRHSAGLTASVSKASAGAVEYMPIAKVPNLSQLIDKLKENGVWIFAAESGGSDYTACDFNIPSAIILGGEGTGVSRILKEKSDFVVSIPMYGQVNSLNVSNAAAVILYEARRQRNAVKA